MKCLRKSLFNAVFVCLMSLGTLRSQTSAQTRCKVTFAPAATISAGTDVTGIASGDFNNDGIPDLVSVAPTNGFIDVALGKGNGTFAPWLGSLASYSPRYVAVGKFDGLNLDAVVNDSAFGNALVMLGNGEGYFPSSTPLDLNGAYTNNFAIADFNGDHRDDLAMTDGVGNEFIFLSNGDGTFQGPQVFTTGGIDPEPIVASDFNGDGIVDLAVLNVDYHTGRTGSLAVLLGKGDGTFGSPQLTPFPSGAFGLGLAVGDFNLDGKLDLALTASTTSSQTDFVVILLGKGDGTFARRSTTMSGPGYGSLGVGDFNGDGKLDVVVADDNDSFVGYTAVLLGNGDGTLQPASYFPANGKGTDALIVGDFNLDGKLDIATVNSTSSNISILLNTTPPCTSKAP